MLNGKILVECVEAELDKAHIESNLLLAYSGGLDSTCLLELLIRAGHKPILAHCNFKLRGKESDADAAFAKQQSEKFGLSFHMKEFETDSYAQENGISIQMAARELRYDWFRSLVSEHRLAGIATGAHLDDQLEGMLIKLGRSAGPASLSGMSVWNGELFRPLLSFSRSQLEEFVSQEALPFREDSSNASNKYERNALRHKVIPAWKEEVSDLLEAVDQSRKWILEMETFASAELREFLKLNLKASEQEERLSLDVIQSHRSPSLLLFYWLSDKGFTSSQLKNILECLDSPETKKFHAGRWTLNKDRNALCLRHEDASDLGEVFLKEGETTLNLGALSYEVFVLEKAQEKYAKDTIYFNAKDLEFPLRFRRWQEGDRMQPLGMEGNKKISDLLIDLKVDGSKKSVQYVLESKGSIHWLVDHRQAEQSKLKEGTKKLLCFRQIHLT